MNDEAVKATLADFEELRLCRSEGKLSPVEAAMYVEDCFRVALSDDDISEANLEDAAAVGRLLAGKKD